MADEQAPLQTSVNRYRAIALVLGLCGLASCCAGLWMMWRPLAPVAGGAVLLYGAHLAVKLSQVKHVR